MTRERLASDTHSHVKLALSGTVPTPDIEAQLRLEDRLASASIALTDELLDAA